MKKTDIKIDFVITWGGEDEDRRRQRQEYLARERGEQETAESIDAQPVRYRDWDNLHYWFRCVEKFAPWVNRVHLITCGVVPTWLQTEHPKLNVVFHRDYIPERYLPTFNSHPIEWHMHAIQGLSEHFVYFNDDFFLTAPVEPENFFVNGLPCDMLSETPLDCGKNEAWNYVQLNNVALVNRYFSRRHLRRQHIEKWLDVRKLRDFVKNLIFAMVPRDDFFGFTTYHLPQSFLKSTFCKLWELEPQLLHETCSHKFRDIRDVSSYVVRYFQLLSWQFYPYDYHKNGCYFGGRWEAEEVARTICSGKYKMLCINDEAELDFEQAKGIVNAAFDKLVPDKSSFER